MTQRNWHVWTVAMDEAFSVALNGLSWGPTVITSIILLPDPVSIYIKREIHVYSSQEKNLNRTSWGDFFIIKLSWSFRPQDRLLGSVKKWTLSSVAWCSWIPRSFFTFCPVFHLFVTVSLRRIDFYFSLIFCFVFFIDGVTMPITFRNNMVAYWVAAVLTAWRLQGQLERITSNLQCFHMNHPIWIEANQKNMDSEVKLVSSAK